MLINNRLYWTGFDASPAFTIVFVLIFYHQGQKLFDGWGEKDTAGLSRLISMLLDSIETRADDVANWPSVSFWSVGFDANVRLTASVQPFNGIKNKTYIDTSTRWLELIDGGLNLENVPFGSLLVNSRDVDFILAVDAR